MNNPQKDIQTKLTKGLLDLIILELLEDQPMHGYEIITTIRKNFGIYFGPSTIYPLLITMEKKNYVKCEWNMKSDRPKKVYSLTNTGKETLDYTANSLKLICKTMGTDSMQSHAELNHIRCAVAYGPKKTDQALIHR